MSQRNNRDYLDFEKYDESIDSRDYRRRQYNRRQSSFNGRQAYNVRPKKRKSFLLTIIAIICGSAIAAGAAVVFISNGGSKLIWSVPENSSVKEETVVQPATENAVSQENDLLSPAVFNAPKPSAETSSEGKITEGGVYVWNKQAFELFGGTKYSVQAYSETVNSLAGKLSGINTYCIVIPNHSEMGLPDSIKETLGTNSQSENIREAYSGLGENIVPVNIYNYLSEHCNEYIYYKSDHHWTGLGAYYAYKAFADTLKLKPLSLDNCEKVDISGFEGSFYSLAPSDIDTDVVSYWKLPYEVSMTITEEGGNVLEFDSPYYEGATSGNWTYGVFIEGDNPLTVLKSSSPDALKGKKIAVMKESYGNAFVPYLTQNFEEVHIMDLRTFRENAGTDFVSYCTQNGITDVLFMNGVMSANAQVHLDSMTAQFK